MYSWFTYLGGNRSTSRNYKIISGEPSCHGNKDLCAIFAEIKKNNCSCNPQPIITQELYEAINNSLNTHLESDIVKLKS